MISKIGIGTVQFGLEYGISNRTGITSLAEANEILVQAQKNQIFMIDTARAYGSSEKVLGEIGIGNFKVVSKFLKPDANASLTSQLEETLRWLNIETLYGYLAHHADTIIDEPDLWSDLQSLKQQGLIQKIGLSVYSPEQLEKSWQLGIIPEIVQLPYNLLDRKFEPYFEKLKEKGTEIHVRSVFLQGLFFLKEEEIKSKLQPLKAALREIRDLSTEYGISVEKLALNFVIHNAAVDYVIMGVNNVAQLTANIDSVVSLWNESLTDKIRQIQVTKPELLNPVNWK